MILEGLLELRGIQWPGRHVSEHGDWWGAPQSLTGIEVSSRTALANTAVNQALTLISGTVSSLPFLLYDRSLGEGMRAESEHLYELLHDQPNPEMTAATFVRAQYLNKLVHGARFAEIEVDQYGAPLYLWHIPSEFCQPRRAYKRLGGGVTFEAANANPEDRRRGGVIVFEVTNGVGPPDYIEASRMFHVPGLTFDGVTGLSPIRYAIETIGLGLAMQASAAAIFGNRATPAVVLERPAEAPELTKAGERNLISAWEADVGGVRRRGRTAVLQEGTTMKVVTMPLDELQFVENFKQTVPEVARIYNCPPYFLGHDVSNGVYANVELEWMRLVTQTLLPHLEADEQEVRRKLLSGDQAKRGLYAEYETKGLLRGDSAARAAFYKVMRELGVMTPTQIARAENLPPVPANQGGDSYAQPAPAPVSTSANSRSEPAPPAPAAAPAPAHGLRLQRVLEAAFVRVVAKEASELRKAAERLSAEGAAAVAAAVDEFYLRHVRFVAQVVGPGLAGDAEGYAQRYVFGHRTSVRELLARYGAAAGDEIGKLLDRWATTVPSEEAAREAA